MIAEARRGRPRTRGRGPRASRRLGRLVGAHAAPIVAAIDARVHLAPAAARAACRAYPRKSVVPDPPPPLACCRPSRRGADRRRRARRRPHAALRMGSSASYSRVPPSSISAGRGSGQNRAVSGSRRGRRGAIAFAPAASHAAERRRCLVAGAEHGPRGRPVVVRAPRLAVGRSTACDARVVAAELRSCLPATERTAQVLADGHRQGLRRAPLARRRRRRFGSTSRSRCGSMSLISLGCRGVAGRRLARAALSRPRQRDAGRLHQLPRLRPRRARRSPCSHNLVADLRRRRQRSTLGRPKTVAQEAIWPRHGADQRRQRARLRGREHVGRGDAQLPRRIGAGARAPAAAPSERRAARRHAGGAGCAAARRWPRRRRATWARCRRRSEARGRRRRRDAVVAPRLQRSVQSASRRGAGAPAGGGAAAGAALDGVAFARDGDVQLFAAQPVPSATRAAIGREYVTRGCDPRPPSRRPPTRRRRRRGCCASGGRARFDRGPRRRRSTCFTRRRSPQHADAAAGSPSAPLFACDGTSGPLDAGGRPSPFAAARRGRRRVLDVAAARAVAVEPRRKGATRRSLAATAPRWSNGAHAAAP